MQPRIVALLPLIVLLSACATAQPDGGVMTDRPTEAMMEDASPDIMMTEYSITPEPMATEAAAAETMAETPAWFGATLTNVSTGETFTINDFRGKVILVEAMAQWCPKCFQQQIEVRNLHSQLATPDELVTIALDIDPNEEAATLKDYAANSGFGWIYAVSPADVSREIGNLYGAQFLNPPSTPILIIDRKGEAHVLPFGIKSADTLLQAIMPFLEEGM